MSTSQTNIDKPSALKFFLDTISQFKVRVGLLFLGEMAQAVGLVLLPYTIRGLIDTANAWQADLHGDFFTYIHGNVLDFIYASLLIVFSSRLSGTALGFTVPYIRIPARQRLFDRLKNHSMNYFQNRLGGTFGSKINDTSAGIVFALFIFAFTMLPLVIVFTASLYALFKMNTSIALIVISWGTIYCLAVGLCAIPMARISQEMARQRAYIAGRIIDVASNIATVKSYAREEIEATRLNEDQKGETAAIIKYQFWREGLSWFHFLFGYGMLAFVMYVAMHSFEQENLTVGSLSFIFTILLVLLDQIRSLSNSLRDFMNYIGQMRDGVQTIMQPPTIVDVPDTAPLEINEGRIKFRNVDFVYKDSQQQFSFNGLSVMIEPRQKVGLMGPSGAGKSTLVSLLLRFYDLQGGSILIDGQDIRHVTQSSLRENIAIIPQDTSLFHRTMMENIRYGRLDASDEEVIDAARKAHAHDFISKLPQGYETMVGERGVKLSGGQRQRIAIARAILKNAPILVLDEATSALDSESEKLIQNSLDELMQGKTVIAIAHRLSTISSMDRLLVMENGSIIEDGTHDELVACNGHYARMWALQSGGFLPE